METWEYFTTTIRADTEQTPVPIMDGVPRADHPRHSVYSLIPQLNAYGKNGWELVSTELVGEEKNGKLRPAAGPGFATETYFVTLKRRRAE